MATKAAKNEKKTQPRRAYYAVLPASVRYDVKICPNAKLLFAEVTALSNEKGYCWATNNYFAALYEVTAKTVSRWVSQLTEHGYIYVEIDQAAGNQRRIYIFEVLPGGMDKNVHRGMDKKEDSSGQKCPDPLDKNVHHNNTDNTTKNNLSGKSLHCLSQEEAEREKDKHRLRALLRRYGVSDQGSLRIVFEENTPRSSIEEAIKNGLAKHDAEKGKAGGFELAAGYIVQALKNARAEGHEVTASKASRKFKDHIDERRNRKKSEPITEQKKQNAIARLEAAAG